MAFRLILTIHLIVAIDAREQGAVADDLHRWIPHPSLRGSSTAHETTTRSRTATLRSTATQDREVYEEMSNSSRAMAKNSYQPLQGTMQNQVQTSDYSPLIDVYFGAGCYWRIQHEFVQAERNLLGRNDQQITSRTGYAGGTLRGPDGRVCYHNFQNIADYSKLGHAEVVEVKLPQDKIVDFSDAYFRLFDPDTGDLVNPVDGGPEYRSVIGFPKGMDNPVYTVILAAANTTGFSLELGNGNDPDTVGKDKLVYIYDSNKFPFYQAEVFMQFRDDFQSDPYGKDYNRLVELALDDGRIIGQGCPDTV